MGFSEEDIGKILKIIVENVGAVYSYELLI
jgi:hypothetical protein